MSRRPRGQFPVASAVVSVTCVSDGQAHSVPDDELAGRSRLDGYYTAVCGHVVTAAPMEEPDGAPCAVCADRVPH